MRRLVLFEHKNGIARRRQRLILCPLRSSSDGEEGMISYFAPSLHSLRDGHHHSFFAGASMGDHSMGWTASVNIRPLDVLTECTRCATKLDEFQRPDDISLAMECWACHVDPDRASRFPRELSGFILRMDHIGGDRPSWCYYKLDRVFLHLKRATLETAKCTNTNAQIRKRHPDWLPHGTKYTPIKVSLIISCDSCWVTEYRRYIHWVDTSL